MARLEPQWVLVPRTKVALAPCGVREPRQIIKAAEVASQIGAAILVSPLRTRPIMEWRTAAMFVLFDIMPSVTKQQAARVFNRDRTTILHALERREADPGYLADKVKAIKEVLV